MMRFTRFSVERDRKRRLAVGFALLQLADATGNMIVPERYVTAHLDHLRVPKWLQPMLPRIKVISSIGLLLGLRWPRLGVLTSSCLIGYYASAVGFHLRAPEHPILAAPACAFGVGAAAVLVGVYLPNVRSDAPSVAPPNSPQHSTAARFARLRRVSGKSR